MPISTVLFDADGVLQSAGPMFDHFESEYGWSRQRLRDLFRHVETQRRDYQLSETGARDAVEVLALVLPQWGWTEPVERFVELWLERGMVPDPEAFGLVAALRKAGIRCALGTNQSEVRARYMRDELGYDALFDHSFYSCWLGCGKPDPAFFEAVLATLSVPAAEVLFIDDHEPNVVAARGCGLYAELHRPGMALSDTLARYGVVW